MYTGIKAIEVTTDENNINHYKWVELTPEEIKVVLTNWKSTNIYE